MACFAMEGRDGNSKDVGEAGPTRDTEQGYRQLAPLIGCTWKPTSGWKKGYVPLLANATPFRFAAGPGPRLAPRM